MSDLEPHAVERADGERTDDVVARRRNPGAGPVDAPGPGPGTTVPEGDDPAWCPHCDRPFRRAHLRDLHVGEEHAEAMTDVEAAAYETAVDSETDDLFVYHLKVVGTIVLLLMGLAYLYAFVLA